MKEDFKEYIESRYRLAVSDYKLVHTEDEQWEARNRIAKLELTATEVYGNAYVDELHE